MVQGHDPKADYFLLVVEWPVIKRATCHIHELAFYLKSLDRLKLGIFVRLCSWPKFYNCITLFAVVAVIPPHILARARINRHRGESPSQLQTNLQKSISTFEPSGLKCCKLGEKTAKKKLSCHIHDSNRMKNMMHRISNTYSSSRILVAKAEKCGEKYSRPFEKCCNYREGFYRDMHRCRINFSDREDRRKCKILVRQKYPWISENQIDLD